MNHLSKTSLLLLALSAALCGCIAEGDTKFGDVGEPCFIDNDCREAFLCAQGSCVDPLASANNGSSNNGSSNNGVSNNGVSNNGAGACDPDTNDRCVCLDEEGFLCAPPSRGCLCEELPPTMQLGCGDLCVYLEDCGIEGGRACLSECANALEPYNPSEQQQIFSCLRSLSCDEILGGAELCFGPTGGDGGVEPSPGPGPRQQVCDELAFLIKEEFSCDFDVYEPCLRGAALYNDDLFYQIYDCLEDDSCREIRQCVERWSDI